MSNTYPIVTVSDSRYLPAVQFCLESILYRYSGTEKIKFYIVYHTDDLLKKEIDDFLYYFSSENVDIKFVTSPDLESEETQKIFESYSQKKTKYLDDLGHGHSVVPNWRALRKTWIHDAVPEDKILYLDCDTYLLKDIQHVFNFQTDIPFAAAIDPWPVAWTHLGGIFNKEVAGANLFNRTHLVDPYMPYFNTGVFVTSLNYWRVNDFTSKVKKFMNEFVILYTDQDILNCLFKNNFTILPSQFNAQGKMLFRLNGYINYNQYPDSPVIVHFSSDFKPCFKRFDKYRLYDTPENELVDSLPNEYNITPIIEYNKIKRMVLIKELYMTMLNRKPENISKEEIVNYANSTLSISNIARSIKNSLEYKNG